MPDVSAAIIVLSGAVLTLAASLAGPLTEGSRQKLAGIGRFLWTAGLVAWIVTFALEIYWQGWGAAG